MDTSDSAEVEQREKRVFLWSLERERRSTLAPVHVDIEWRREQLEARISRMREHAVRDRAERSRDGEDAGQRRHGRG
jgi:hypothetical protein